MVRADQHKVGRRTLACAASVLQVGLNSFCIARPAQLQISVMHDFERRVATITCVTVRARYPRCFPASSAAILRKIRPVRAPATAPGRGRIVFSSNGTPIRATGTRVVAQDNPWLSWAGGIAAGLFATLFPSDCRICGAPLINISRLPVCEECLGAMRPIAGGTCCICGERLVSPFAFSGTPCAEPDASAAEPRCGLCRRLEPPYVKATAYGSYESGLRELIHLLKYDQVRPAANVLGRMLADAIEDLQPLLSGREIVVVPVPLHTIKLRQRG